MTATLQDAIAFIHGADDSDIKRMQDALKARHKALRDIRAASVREGSEVVTSGLSPKYLDGLRGVVRNIKGQRASLHITDDASLRQITGTKYGPFAPVDEYTLSGIPLSCFTERT